jgi:hypothetical protein
MHPVSSAVCNVIQIYLEKNEVAINTQRYIQVKYYLFVYYELITATSKPEPLHSLSPHYNGSTPYHISRLYPETLSILDTITTYYFLTHIYDPTLWGIDYFRV